MLDEEQPDSLRRSQRAMPSSRHWLWPAGWFVTGVGTMLGDIFSQPSDAPLWTAYLMGAAGWGLAGSAWSAGLRRVALGLVWGLLFAASLLLGMHWGSILEGRGGPGFVGLVGACGLAGAVGGLATLRGGGMRRWLPGFYLLPLWGGLFALATWVAVGTGYLAVLIADQILDPLVGDAVSGALGWGLGWAVGGAVAGLSHRLEAAAAA